MLRIAIGWLALSLPCWLMLLVYYDNWESGTHSVGLCGFYPCEIVVAMAVIRFVIPIGAMLSIGVLVWSLAAFKARSKTSKDE